MIFLGHFNWIFSRLFHLFFLDFFIALRIFLILTGSSFVFLIAHHRHFNFLVILSSLSIKLYLQFCEYPPFEFCDVGRGGSGAVVGFQDP